MLLIKFFGLRRSGNHAVANWILGLEENMLFLNQINLYEDPVATHSPVSIPEDVRSPKVRVDAKVQKRDILIHNDATLNGNIICTYEHVDMNRLDMNKLNISIYSKLGYYGNDLNVFVLRNIFNVIPSFLIFRSKRKNIVFELEEVQQVVRKLVRLWRGYACLALSPKTETRGNFVPVLYERWLINREYRDEVASKLGFKNKDKNIDFVSDAGGGSSWSGTTNKINKNALLDRWNKTHPNEKKVVETVLKENLDIVDLVSKIFGKSSIPDDLLYLT